MSRTLNFFITLGTSALIVSCASEQTITKTQVKKDPWGNDERYSIGKDDDGNPVMKSDRRSNLEGKRSSLVANRDFSGEDYTKKSYRKKRWGGNTLFARKKYEGNTDANGYKKEPWFVKKQASAQGQRAQSADQKYRVNSFSRTTASEQAGKRLRHTEDAESAQRRRVFKQPEITHWKDQSGLGVADTNRMLGR